ncbi:hypothetical protein RTBOTA2_003100 [Rhodotorula toruloides]|nr:hypothetical protein RTBOTA2_003100 [Rhodotorula toruloides]
MLANLLTSFALVALVNKDGERTWTLVGGTLACVALILATTLHVALLCLPSLPYLNLKTLAVARGVLHALCEGTIVLWGAGRWREREKREGGEEERLPSQGWRDVSAPRDVEAGRNALESSKVRSLALAFLALQALAIALDILSAALPLRSSTTDETVPQLLLFGTATSPVGNVVLAALGWVRWMGMSEIVAALAAKTRPTALPPTSTHLETSLYHHPHSPPPTPTPTPSLRPLPDLPSTPPSPRYERLPSSRAQVQQTRERKSMEKSATTPGQGSVGSSFLLLEVDAEEEEEEEEGTFQPSTTHAQPEIEVEPREEDLVVPSLPVRQAGRLSPSLPPMMALPLLTTPTGSPISRHRPHRSLPTLLTGESPSRPFTPLLTPVTPNDERPSPLSRAGSTSPTLSRWRLPRSSEDKSPSIPPSPTTGKTSAPPSPRKLRRGRGASVSSVPTLSLGPPVTLDAEREKGTHTPASSISRATGRRRSGSVGSILRSFTAGTGGRPSMETKASAAAGPGLWWDVEPNEEEDDPFVRSAPPLPLPASSSSVSMSRASTDGEPSTDEGSGAVTPLRLKKALLEAIQEPDGGDASLASPTRRIDDDEMERMLTPPPPHIEDFDSRNKHSPSAASSIAYAYRARSASQSSSGSVFREHLDMSDGDTSSMPPPSPSSSLALSTFAAFGGGGRTSVPSSPVLAPRRRTDAMISPLMLPRRVASEGANDSSTPQQVASPTPASTRTSSPSITPKASRLPRRLLRQKRPSILSLRSNSAFSTSPASNATPQRRSPSFSPLPTRSSTVSASSNSLFSSPAFASLRRITTPRRSPSPVPSNRPSESSELSFACRGLVDSSSDFNVSLANTFPPFGAPARPSQTGEEVEKVETPSSVRTKRRSRTSKGIRNAWWKQLPSGSRPTTLYRQNSLASHRIRRTSAPVRSSGTYSRPPSYGSGSSAARYLQASPSEGGVGGSSSGHIRSVSLPLPLPPVPSTPPPSSRFELPAISDFSPIGSSIFHLPSRLSGGSPRSTRSRGSPKVSARVAVPVTMPSASFADQQSLRETSSYDTANTSPDYAIAGERFPTTPTPEPLAHELHELTSLVRSFTGSPGGEISTSDGSATPTSTISSLPFTPLSPVFSLDPGSPTLTYSRARQTRGDGDAEEEIELMSPLTPASPGFGRKE